jgi:hypothetical protein
MAAAGSEVVLTLEDEAGTGLREVAVRRAPVSSLAALADCFKLIADLKHKARPRAAAAAAVAARGGARRGAALHRWTPHACDGRAAGSGAACFLTAAEAAAAAAAAGSCGS